ncbi:MAG: hypothetical protein ACRESU_01345 [Gammaproteobacteria bacterium]
MSLAGCGAKGSIESDDAALTLKTYTVPASRAEDLSDTLNHVLRMNDDKNDIGRAWVAGPGQILVLAPARMQDSIANSIKEVVGHEGTAAKPEPLRLEAWVVDTYPGKGPNDPTLKTIQPALDAFAADMGPSHFVAGHYLTSVSDAGVLAEISPIGSEALDYRVTPTEARVVLEFRYRDSGAHLNGKVTSNLGQTLVLGLASDVSDGKNARSVRRLLVVRIVPANQG